MPEKDTPFLIASYEKLEGTQSEGPYVRCFASAIGDTDESRTVAFKMRVDTGADLTIIPTQYLAVLEPLESAGAVLCRLGGQVKRRISVKKVTVNILTDNTPVAISLPDGAMGCTGEYGYLGMDVLQHLDVRLCDGKVYLTQNGGA